MAREPLQRVPHPESGATDIGTPGCGGLYPGLALRVAAPQQRESAKRTGRYKRCGVAPSKRRESHAAEEHPGRGQLVEKGTFACVLPEFREGTSKIAPGLPADWQSSTVEFIRCSSPPRTAKHPPPVPPGTMGP
eukprot:6042164-Prymnesium_polylepis.1